MTVHNPSIRVCTGPDQRWGSLEKHKLKRYGHRKSENQLKPKRQHPLCAPQRKTVIFFYWRLQETRYPNKKRFVRNTSDEKMRWLLKRSFYFFKLNANRGYLQVKVDKKNGVRTKIISQHDLYRFIRMLSGLRKAPGTFQWTIESFPHLLQNDLRFHIPTILYLSQGLWNIRRASVQDII